MAYYLPDDRILFIFCAAFGTIFLVAVAMGLRRQYRPVLTSVFTSFEPMEEGTEDVIGKALLAAGVYYRRSDESISIRGLGKLSYKIFHIEPGDMRITLQDGDPEIVYVGPLREDNLDEVERLKGLVEGALG